MKTILCCLLTCLLFSCRKDEPIDDKNYIEFDGMRYARIPALKQKFISTSSAPYYSGVTWQNRNKHKEIEVTVANTCTNNRGMLSNFHGYIVCKIRNEQDSVEYYAEFPTFEVKTENTTRYIPFKNMKVYGRHPGTNFLNKDDFKIVSGKVTFE